VAESMPLAAVLAAGPSHLGIYLVVGAVLVACGMAAVLVRRNAIGVLMGVELILNGAGLTAAAFARQHVGPVAIDGQVLTLAIIVLAAAEAAVALGLLVRLRRSHGDLDLADTGRAAEARRMAKGATP
jgi:NADH:ubiquinone oxidoreductase subunit K